MGNGGLLGEAPLELDLTPAEIEGLADFHKEIADLCYWVEEAH